jgi:hypothetical protein
MNKVLIGVAILAISTSAAFAKHKAHHMMKPKAAAAAPAPSGPMMMNPSAADKKMYMKNMHDSGMKMKK